MDISSHAERLAGLLGHVILIILFSFTCEVSAAKSLELQTEDCVKCHAVIVHTIAEFGGRHATQVGCLDCHPQHPPAKENTITACTSCHTGLAHFQIGNCRYCHSDPHQPIVSLQNPIKPARKECLSCHAEVGQQMQTEPSRHAKLFCNHCHSRHKEIPECLECHEPHSSNQASADCLRCHPAHQPLKIIPTGYVPAKFCQACHRKEGRDLAATNTNHGGINCIFCHKGRHPSTPRCQDCHGLPHPQAIHIQFKNCLECHGDAHRLISNR